jgi:hypothetical protein
MNGEFCRRAGRQAAPGRSRYRFAQRGQVLLAVADCFCGNCQGLARPTRAHRRRTRLRPVSLVRRRPQERWQESCGGFRTRQPSTAAALAKGRVNGSRPPDPFFPPRFLADTLTEQPFDLLNRFGGFESAGQGAELLDIVQRPDLWQQPLARRSKPCLQVERDALDQACF